MAKREPTDEQKQIIQTTDCPLLVIAGPGTGKTFTLVKRIISIIKSKKARPEEILMITFTEKAANELITRISKEFRQENITNINFDDMYISTFHSFCHRLLNEYDELCSDVSKNAELLPETDQIYFFKKYIDTETIDDYKRVAGFAGIPGSLDVIDTHLAGISYDYKANRRLTPFSAARSVCHLCSTLIEELADVDKLKASNDPFSRTAGEMLEKYLQILRENDLMTFSTLMQYGYRMLANDDRNGKLRNKFKYIMVDEFQDTNHIQEEMVDLLGGTNHYICVVGDDDQSLYRFRGATVENILKFEERYKNDGCVVKHLSINFRSTQEIVKFYSNFMEYPHGFKWDKCRLPKHLTSPKSVDTNTVVKIICQTKPGWNDAMFRLICHLKDSGKITDYNQIAFLCGSVKNPAVIELQNYLMERDIPIYSPRSNRFFDRDEIKTAVGCMFLALTGNSTMYFNPKVGGFYSAAEAAAKESMELSPELKSFVEKIASAQSLDISYVSLLYRLFAFEPFKSMLEVNTDMDYNTTRAARNLAHLTEILSAYEKRKSIKDIKKDAGYLFADYLPTKIDEGVEEYESPKECAPSGYISFLTIHQSKGLEFPVVICALNSAPPNARDSLSDVEMILTDQGRKLFEPAEDTEYYDFYRKFYTAFSRAKTLLILTNYYKPEAIFTNSLRFVPDASTSTPDLSKLEFDKVEIADICDSYSFTSDILLYESCPKRYKYFRRFGFVPVRMDNKGTLFGTLVHQTIEDIHKCAKNGGTPDVPMIMERLNDNCKSLSNARKVRLEKSLPAAEKQVMNYYRYICARYGKKNPEYRWHNITEAEKKVSLPMSVNGKDYIMKGTIDLVREYPLYYVIFDIKSGRKNDALIAGYNRQLRVYAHMLGKVAQQKDMSMRLFFTGENIQPQSIIKYSDEKENIKSEIDNFSNIVGEIMNNNFSAEAANPETCKKCDFRFFCGKYLPYD